MHNSHDTFENNLHALFLPTENKTHFSSFNNEEDNEMNLDNEDIDFNLINNENMQLLKSLLSILTSCCLIFEQFGKKKQLSAMGMVLTLCCLVTECLSDHTMVQLINDYLKYQHKLLEESKKNKKQNGNKKHKKFKVNDLRLFISKSLMSIFNVFPIEYVEDDIKMNDKEENDDNDEDKDDDQDKQRLDKLHVLRMNMKAIKMCHTFVDYWDLKLTQNDGNNNGRRKRLDYRKISYEWLHSSLMDIGSDEQANTKITVALLEILKKLIPLYNEKKQLQLLLCIDKLLKNSALVNDAKTIFNHIIN